jgi:ABC-type lipoprotein export system ATPase subunit
MIEAQNLQKRYRNHLNVYETVFSELFFNAQTGKVTVIMGPSGSGKTTLLNILATIDKVERGSLVIDGVAIEDLNEHQRAKFRAEKIGFIFQSFALIPEFTVLENCIIPLVMNGMKKAEAKTRVLEMIEHFFGDEISPLKYPNELSGGQQQRVGIVRAIVHRPKVIIADEPTGNLDDKSALVVKEYLQKLAHEEGISVIVVTHDSDYIHYADHLYRFVSQTDQEAKSKLVRDHG